MLWHFVLFNFEDHATPEQRESALAVLRSVGDVPTVYSYVVERNHLPNPTHEWICVGAWVDEAARLMTDDNPAHVEEVQRHVMPVVKDTLVFDTAFPWPSVPTGNAAQPATRA